MGYRKALLRGDRLQTRISRSGAAAAIAVCSTAAIAVFVRTWRLVPHGTTPDTYEQIAATRRLLDGDLPVSDLYPPGVALVLAPAFSIFPDSITTVQAVIVAFSLVLVALAFAAARVARADDASTLLFVAFVALSPAFVTMSRIGLFDAIGTALLVACILAAPCLRLVPWPGWLAFAALLTIAMTVRATNVFIFPVLLVAYAGIGNTGRRLDPVRAAITQPGVLLTAALALTATGLLLAPGLVSGEPRAVPLTPQYAPQHVLFYWFVTFGGLALPLVAPMAVVGAMRVWRVAPAMTAITGYLLIAWPLVHAPYPFVSERYMLLPLFFVLLLAAHGPAEWWRIVSARRSRAAAGRITSVLAPVLLVAFSAMVVGRSLAGWGDDTGLSDESALEELRPAVAALEDGSLIVTALARGFEAEPDGREYVDLIDRRIDMNDRESSVRGLVGAIESAIDAGHPVYYVYSRFERDRENAGLGGDGLEIYFAAVTERFTVEERFRASQEEYRIYQVTDR